MPIIVTKTVKLEIKNIARRQGIREYYKARPEIRGIIEELVATVEKTTGIQGRIMYNLYPIQKIDKYTINVNNIDLSGKSLSILSSANEIAISVCTVGDELEKMVSYHFSNGKALRGLLLDGIGSAAVDSISQQACQIITEEALSRGLQSSSPVSPGMPGFDIKEQGKLFKLIEADKIGIRLLPSGIMTPQKSVSMIIGLGRNMIKFTPAEFCRGCPINKTCTHRVY